LIKLEQQDSSRKTLSLATRREATTAGDTLSIGIKEKAAVTSYRSCRKLLKILKIQEILSM
jgi:hypothetical protein